MAALDDLTVRRSDLRALTPLGRGGTAIVYRAGGFSIPGVPDLVYKEYKKSTRRIAGPALLNSLLPFVRFREKLEPKLQWEWDQRIIWPLRVVIDDQQAAIGVLMPLIQPRYFQEVHPRSGPVRSAPRELDLLFGDPADLARIGIAPVDERTRLTLITRIAAVYAMMHKAGVVIGDVSARNIVYNPDPAATSVLVVDADSARIQGNRAAFSSQPHTPHWEPPEVLLAARRLGESGLGQSDFARLRNVTTVQTTATDVYKFALVVIRIMDPGRGKAITRDPSSAIRRLHTLQGPRTARILEQSLADAPAERPSMREWFGALSGRPLAPAERKPAVHQGLTPEPTITEGKRNGSWVFASGKWIRPPRTDGSK